MSDQTLSTSTENKKRVFTVSASSLDSMACETKYNYGHLQRLVPMQMEEALDFGGLIHWMLHPYYFSKIKPEYLKPHHTNHVFAPLLNLRVAQVIEACIAMGREKALVTDLEIKERQEAIGLFRSYVEHRINDRWHTIEVEQPFSKILYEDDNLIIVYEGKVDLITEIEQDGVTIVDNKTGGRDRHIPETNNQIIGSCWAFGVNKFLINKALRVKDDPFRRDIYYALPEQKDEWVKDTIHNVRRIIHYIDNDYFPMQRSQCGVFGNCRYLKACKAPPSARYTMLNGLFRKSRFGGLYAPDPLLEEIAKKVLGKYEPAAHTQVLPSDIEQALEG